MYHTCDLTYAKTVQFDTAYAKTIQFDTACVKTIEFDTVGRMLGGFADSLLFYRGELLTLRGFVAYFLSGIPAGKHLRECLCCGAIHLSRPIFALYIAIYLIGQCIFVH